ncbi:MAG: hypothetical protein ACLFPE_14245 [Bacteroidales bacterium]
MKTFCDRLVIPVFYLLIFALIILCHACKEETEIPPSDPSQRQYLGTWEGNTIQTAMVKILLTENEHRQVVVSEAGLNYMIDGDLRQMYLENKTGLSILDSGTFEFHLPDGGSVTGRFSDNQLNGWFETYHLTGQPTGIPFRAVPENDSLSLYAICRATFVQSGNKTVNLVQDQRHYFPVGGCRFADSGYVAVSAMHMGSWENGGAPFFSVEGGLIENPDPLHDLFHTGSKNFSRHATDGFRIFYIDRGNQFRQYFTLEDSLMPSASYFRITALEKIEHDIPDLIRYKFTAEFDLWMYSYWGDSINLQNGFYSGYLENSLLPSPKK